jgi:hypothetical protein
MNVAVKNKRTRIGGEKPRNISDGGNQSLKFTAQFSDGWMEDNENQRRYDAENN